MKLVIALLEAQSTVASKNSWIHADKNDVAKAYIVQKLRFLFKNFFRDLYQNTHNIKQI